jgi:hypothetical protein
MQSTDANSQSRRDPVRFASGTSVNAMTTATPQRRGAVLLPLAALVGLAMALSACTAQLAELPVVGLPAGAPERLAEPLPFPAVHDMPAPRASKPMTQDQLKSAAAELEAARDRQPGRPPAAAKKTATKNAKKPATAARPAPETTGTARNP